MAELIKELKDLTYLSWTKTRNSSGTAGSFLKSQEVVNGKKIYYKISNFDSVNGITGHECINELIADRLMEFIGIPHLSYSLIHAKVVIDRKEYETYLCASEDYKEHGESKLALDAFFQMEKTGSETPMEFCRRLGWEEYIGNISLIDFLIINRDRHGANIEVLRNPKIRSLRLSPIFDNGLSFVFSCKTPEEVKNFDCMADRPVQSFVGSNSLYGNLSLSAPAYRRKLPSKVGLKEYLFRDIYDLLSKETMEKICEIVDKRWDYYENFCDKG